MYDFTCDCYVKTMNEALVFVFSTESESELCGFIYRIYIYISIL